MSDGALSPAGGAPSATAGRAFQLAGIYAKYARADSMASNSDAANTSPSPLTEQCMRAPPIVSWSTFSPMTISAMRGEPKYALAFLSTMMTTSDNAGKYAAPAGDGQQNLVGLQMLDGHREGAFQRRRVQLERDHALDTGLGEDARRELR